MENKVNKENQRVEKYMKKSAKEFANSYNDEFYCSVIKTRATLSALSSISKKLMKTNEFNKEKLVTTFNRFGLQYKQMYEIVKSLVEK